MNLTPGDVVLLLTNRLVQTAARPLSAGQFWDLVNRVDDVARLPELSAAQLENEFGVPREIAERVPILLEAMIAFSFERERLQESGVTLVSCFDGAFPSRLVDVLGRKSPASLMIAGNTDLLTTVLRGVVGSRAASEESTELAEVAARRAVARNETVVSGLAKGIDRTAMGAALAEDAGVVGVPSEGLRKVARQATVRSMVHEGRLCLVSPFGPDVPFTVGNAMARNKIVYGLSTSTLVVCSDKGKGGTWSGAEEALKGNFAQVDVWTGPGAGPGNRAIVDLGGRAARTHDDLWEADFVPGRPAKPRQPELFD